MFSALAIKKQIILLDLNLWDMLLLNTNNNLFIYINCD